MKTSNEIVKITASFLKAQKKIESVIKDKTNPYFKSKYADLTGVIDACKDKLNSEGIAILQPIDGMNVETILIHESGEWFSSLTPIVSKEANNPQMLGSAITYAKRYGLQSMVLLPADDDDGQSASKEVKAEPKKAKVMITEFQMKKIHALLAVKGKTKEDIYKAYKIKSLKELEVNQASLVIDRLNKIVDQTTEVVSEKELPVEQPMDEKINPEDIPF